MAKRNSLLPENFGQPEAPADAPRADRRTGGNAKRYHLGGYFDHDDKDAEAFRMLATKTRRKQQDLLAEAIRDLVAKYRTKEAFGE